MHQRDFISPRQLAAAIGVSESSLKRWTDKGLLPVNKTAGGHRRIPLAQAVQFLRTTRTPLVNPEFIGIKAAPEFAGGNSPMPAAAMHEHLLAGDIPAAVAVAVRCYLSDQSMAGVCDRVIQPAMYAVGEDWEAGRIGVFQEHRASQACLAMLNELRRMLPEPATEAGIAVGGAGPTDPYLLPTAMVQLALTELGWRAVCLGAYVPLKCLEEAAGAYKARLVWVSLSNAVDGEFSKQLNALQERLRTRHAMVVVGGRSVNSLQMTGMQRVPKAVRLGDLPGLLNAQPAPRAADTVDLVGL